MNTTARLAAFRWEVEWGLLMPTVLLDTLSTKSGKSIQLHRRYIDGIVGAASCRREELEAFINFVANEGSLISEIELPFLDITYGFLIVGYKPPSTTKTLTLTTTSISPLSIFITANVLSLTASFSASVHVVFALLCAIREMVSLYQPWLSSFTSWKRSTEGSNH